MIRTTNPSTKWRRRKRGLGLSKSGQTSIAHPPRHCPTKQSAEIAFTGNVKKNCYELCAGFKHPARNKYFNAESCRMSVTAHRSTTSTATHSHRSRLHFPKSK